MDWFLYDNGLRHERVKQTFLRKPYITKQVHTYSVGLESFISKIIWPLGAQCKANIPSLGFIQQFCSQMFIKKLVLKNFAKIHRNHLRWCIFLIKLQTYNKNNHFNGP